ncbi:hypothetical protein UA70_19680 [Raoultella planticola]|nr:hypothetical protein UA70_19680 [Raoultella planticola]
MAASTGVFTDRVGVLSNDFFVNLLSMATVWNATDEQGELFEGRDRQSGESKYTATRADLSSVRTQSCGRWRKFTPARMLRRNWLRTLLRPGPK